MTGNPGAERRRVQDLVEVGYEVHICYLWLPSPDLSVARVRGRVRSGGHDVHETVVRRRFWKSLVDFDRLYRPDSTTWQVYDGSAVGRRPLIARGTGAGELTVFDEPTWRVIRQRIEELP